MTILDPSDDTPNFDPIEICTPVHTEIIYKCTAALVNNKTTKLDQKLNNGDLVEIIINKNRKSQNRDWIKFAATKRAQDKIKSQARKFLLASFKKIVPGLK